VNSSPVRKRTHLTLCAAPPARMHEPEQLTIFAGEAHLAPSTTQSIRSRSHLLLVTPAKGSEPVQLPLPFGGTPDEQDANEPPEWPPEAA
jgi:hypothetical protein